MSVRAHEVKKIIRGDVVFNLWHDELLMELIQDTIYDSLNSDGLGLTEISEDEIKEAQACLKDNNYSGRYTAEEIKETKEILDRMLKLAKKYDGYLLLDCF